MNNKIISSTIRRTVHAMLLPEWDRPYALRRRNIQAKFAQNKIMVGAKLADLFSEEINKEIKSIRNAGQLGDLVTLYCELTPYSIGTEKEKEAFPRLSSMTLSEIRQDPEDKRTWSSITLYKQFIYLDARKLIKKLDKDLIDPKARELYCAYYPFIIDSHLMY